jgi:hypothetical protein
VHNIQDPRLNLKAQAQAQIQLDQSRSNSDTPSVATERSSKSSTIRYDNGAASSSGHGHAEGESLLEGRNAKGDKGQIRGPSAASKQTNSFRTLGKQVSLNPTLPRTLPFVISSGLRESCSPTWIVDILFDIEQQHGVG